MLILRTMKFGRAGGAARDILKRLTGAAQFVAPQARNYVLRGEVGLISCAFQIS